MSADYWKSTQRKMWTFTREELIKLRSELQEGVNAWDDNVRMFIFEQVQRLGQRLELRQRALATAHVYLLRAYTRIKLSEINVFLLVAAAVYVACKAEELPQHIRTICNESRALWPDYMPHEATQIAECEFYLIDELRSCLIVHHAYRTLDTLMSSMEESTNKILALSPEEKQSTWSIVTDSYASDAPLLFAPHVIAASALYMTILLRPQLSSLSRHPGKVKARIDVLANYLGRSGINLEYMAECIQELVSCYYRWAHFDSEQASQLVSQSLNISVR